MPNPITSGVQPVQGPQRSGFNKSYKNLLTAKIGTLVPILCDPVIPGTRVNLRDAFVMQMPPLATDTFMNLKLKQEAFFVPASALYGGFNDWVTQRQGFDPYVPESTQAALDNHCVLPRIPLANLTYNEEGDEKFIVDTEGMHIFHPGSLADYLGCREISQLSGVMPEINPFPFLAYHRIYDRFYRNTLVTRPNFYQPTYSVVPDQDNQVAMGDQLSGLRVSCLPYMRITKYDFDRFYGASARIAVPDRGNMHQRMICRWSPWISTDTDKSFLGAHLTRSDPEYYLRGTIYGLRQRNFGADYFTTATPTAQKGDPAAVEFKVSTSTGDGQITIAAIRSMNALQLWRERNNISDDDIHAYNRAHYNVNKTGYGESLPLYLGSASNDVYSRGVDVTSQPSSQVSTQNPFDTVGAEYGRAEGSGNVSLIDGFEAPEFGYIMVLASIVPEVNYSSGWNRHMLELVNDTFGQGDIPDALLQSVGPQEVFKFEVASDILGAGSAGSPNAWKGVFGYQQRYAHYMDRINEIHGLFRAGESLEAFALQRYISGAGNEISSEFLPIPPQYLDDISAVKNSLSEYGYWLDVYFDYHVSMPLAAYSIPSLENPSGPTEWIPKAGYKLH